MTETHSYRLGLPAWAFPGWKNQFFSDRPSRLASYARVFNTVEGNTTFYRVPDERSVERWHDAVDQTDFEFCFKLPREVTHDPQPDLAILTTFLRAVAPLGRHVGPLLLQFPATVAPQDLAMFAPVFDAVAERHRFAIEVRHPAFFATPAALEPVLERYGAGRVVMDSRPLFLGDLSHPEVQKARHEKPDVPVVDTVYHDVTMVRLILHPNFDSNAHYIEDWAERIAKRLAEGTRVYMMIHCPNNLHCPPLARRFHNALGVKLAPQSVPTLAPWPVPSQAGLFD